MNDARIAKLYDYAYEGEVVGVYLFTTLAESAWGAEHRDALLRAADLERQTRDLLEPLLKQRNVPLCDDARGAASAASYHEKFIGGTWEAFCHSLVDWSADAMDKFNELRDLVGPEERSACQQLADHERALIGFAKASGAGDGVSAVRRLDDHINKHH